MHKNPLPRNTRFDILKNDEANPFMQRRTKSYPNMSTIRDRDRDRNAGNKLRRINSARFESKSRIKYKPRLDVNSMTMFPQLGKIVTSPKISRGPSFSKIIQNLEESTDTVDKNPIKKGWVRLTKGRENRVKFEYNYEEEESMEDNEDYHDSAQKVMTSMVHRWQDYRDYQNETYGDMSPYWNTGSLLESQSEDEDDYLDDSESEYEDN